MPPTIIFRTDGPWGAGKGSNLTPPEVDTNFWELAEALAAVVALEPVNIANIVVDGNQMTIILEDATEFGPFTLPTAQFRWRGDWEDGTTYLVNDVFAVSDGINDGVYLVRQEHDTDSESEFNPNDGNMQGPFVVLMLPYPNLYDIGFFFPGTPGLGIDVGEAMFTLRANKPFFLRAGLTGSVAGLEESTTEELVFPIHKNSIEVGTFTIGPQSESESEGETGVFDFPDDVQWLPGDRLRVLRPAELDDTARDFTMTLSARRGTL